MRFPGFDSHARHGAVAERFSCRRGSDVRDSAAATSRHVGRGQNKAVDVMNFSRILKLLIPFLLVSASAFGIDREAFTFTHYDLDVKIDGPLQGLIAKGKVTLRNDTDAPQHLAVLQISSTLEWQSIK